MNTSATTISGSARPSRTGRWTRKARRDTTSARSRICAATSTALAYYRKYFKGTGLDISGVTAVLIAGIYYLYLHRSKSTFCGLDLNTEKDSRRLLRLLSRTVHTLFAEAGKSTSDDSIRNAELARRMGAKGLDRAAICDILGLTPDELAALLPE